MRKHLEHIIPAAVIGLLVIVFALLVGSKVYAQNEEEARREHREAVESAYITTVKEQLRAEGFSNSGVNMTKATNESGEWEYTVTIYHRSFEWMEDNDRADLEKKLAEMGSNSLGKISLDLLTR